MQLDELSRYLGCPAPEGAGSVEVSGVSFDSREARPGDLFCCVPGGHVDGHRFAAAALAGGAAALLVERALDVGAPQLVVPSVRAAMGQAAAVVYGRPSEQLRVVGITGTNGKTTTAFMVASILEAAGQRVGLTGTVETRVAGRREPVRHTTPEAPDLHRLLRRMLDAGCSSAVMEVSSHALDQGRVGGVHFDVAAFTNLTQDHLDYHATMATYFEAKSSLFDPSTTSMAVVDVDSDWGVELAARCVARGLPAITASCRPGSGAGVVASVTGMTPTSLDLELLGQPATLPLGGAFNAANAAVAAGIAVALGVEPEQVVKGLAAMPAVPGRFEPVDAGQPFGVLVDYAHTPDGVENVLRAARATTAPGARLICVLGCGGDRDRAKRPLMGRAAAALADHVVVTSDNPRSESPSAIIAEMLPGVRAGSATFEVEPDRRSAIRSAVATARGGDVVVIAGKGHETGQEVGGVVHPFDDRVVAREELEALQ